MIGGHAQSRVDGHCRRVVPEQLELPPTWDTAYYAFVDPSGGSQDSMTLAIAHHHDGTAVLDAVLNCRKTRIGLVLAAALYDWNTAKLLVRIAHMPG